VKIPLTQLPLAPTQQLPKSMVTTTALKVTNINNRSPLLAGEIQC
jgi:hypothetical protein